MKVAALDLGTNTFLMLIAEVEKNAVTKIYRDELRVTRMGQGVHQNRKFHPEALARARDCFKDFAAILAEEKPQRVLAMATSAARDVSNGHELFEIGASHGIEIQVIEGQMEARMTFEGATYDYPSTDGLVVIDVGGGSTEVIGRMDGTGLTGKSVDVGSVRLTELFVPQHPIPSSDLVKLQTYAREQFETARESLPSGDIREVIAVAGTPTTLAAVMQAKPMSEDAVHGYVIKLNELEIWRDRLAAMDLESRKALPGMDPRRADVICSGICILIESLKAIGADRLTVSARGVRYGVAIEAART